MPIVDGKVEFTRRITTGDYQHKDAKVSLTFVVGDQEDAVTMLEYVGNRAVERALIMVGEKAGFGTARVAAEQRAAERSAPSGETVVPAKAERVKAVIADEHEAVAKSLAGTPVRNLADIMGEVAPNPTATAALPAEPAAEPEQPALPVAITDKRLNEEVSAKNAALITAAGSDDTQRQLATQKVLHLVDEYTQLPPGPGRLSKVPADKRQAFLEALGALT